LACFGGNAPRDNIITLGEICLCWSVHLALLNSLHYFFLQTIPLFPHLVTIVCYRLIALTVSNISLFTPALLRTHSFVFFAVHETLRIFLSHFISKASKRVFSFFLSVQVSQPYVATWAIWETENARLENMAPNYRTGKCGKRHVWKAKCHINHMHRVSKTSYRRLAIGLILTYTIRLQ